MTSAICLDVLKLYAIPGIFLKTMAKNRGIIRENRDQKRTMEGQRELGKFSANRGEKLSRN
jgi:hypothetical protein